MTATFAAPSIIIAEWRKTIGSKTPIASTQGSVKLLSDSADSVAIKLTVDEQQATQIRINIDTTCSSPAERWHDMVHPSPPIDRICYFLHDKRSRQASIVFAMPQAVVLSEVEALVDSVLETLNQ